MIAPVAVAETMKTIIDAGCVNPSFGIVVAVWEDTEPCGECNGTDRITVVLPEFGLNAEDCDPVNISKVTIDAVEKLRRMNAAPNN